MTDLERRLLWRADPTQSGELRPMETRDDLKAAAREIAHLRERLAAYEGAIDRAAAIIPEQTPEMLATADRLRQAALDQGFHPGTRPKPR